MDLFVIISEKLYCSRLITGVDNLKKVNLREKNMYFENIQYKTSISNVEKKNYREIDYEEKNYFFLFIWFVIRELDINLYFL